jgi:hypothetical protein
MNRPTARQIEDAQALADFHANEMRRHERAAHHALLGTVLAILVACLLAWAVLSWADCTASGVAMCGMALTPTRPTLWRRLVRAVRAGHLQWQIRWAEDDIRWLEQDLEAAQHWVAAAPTVIQHRRALLDALRVQQMSAELDSRSR